MKKIIYLLEFFFTFNIPGYINAQNIDQSVSQYVPKAPTVAGLIQYIDCPISYFTGTPQISIPIYEINLDGLKIPISLNYHGSGIRVSQEASWVGLGWSLNCPFIISRTIKCGDDIGEYILSSEDYEKGFLDAPKFNGSNYSDFFESQLNAYPRLRYDSEPDIYFFNLPEVSGKFVFTQDGNVELFKGSESGNLKIDLLRTDNNIFKITDTKGNIYVFSQKETTFSDSNAGGISVGNDDFNVDDFSNKSKYTSTWYLTKILTTKGEIVNFDYEREICQLPTQESMEKNNLIKHEGSSNMGYPEETISRSKNIIDGWRLSKIVWNGGFVDFIGANRNDILYYNYSDRNIDKNQSKPKYLKSIVVSNKLGEKTKYYNFNFDYMNKDSIGKYGYIYKRLMLKSIKDSLDPKIHYDMCYFNQYSFPAKNSHNTDLYGFYNGVEQSSLYCCPVDYNGKHYDGGNKNGYLDYMKTGTLSSLRYPTGIKENFDYSALLSGYSTVFHNKSIVIGTYQPYLDFESYNNIPRINADTLDIDTLTDFDITLYAQRNTKQADNSWYYENPNYPIFVIKKIDKVNNKLEDVYKMIVPNELSDFKNTKDYFLLLSDYHLNLSPGKYIFNLYSPIKDIYFNLSFVYKAKQLLYNVYQPGTFRIKSIYDSQGSRDFTYGPAILLANPKNTYLFSSYDDTYYHEYNIYLVQTSSSIVPMSTLVDGYMYGYPSVTETRSDGGKYIIYNYHCQNETNDSDYPFIPGTPDYHNGLLESQEIHYCNSNNLKKVITYEYTDKPLDVIRSFYHNGRDNNRVGIPYEYDINIPLLKTKTETILNNSGKFEVETNFNYNKYLQKSSEAIEDNGDQRLVKYLYANDEITLQDTSIMNKMLKNNMIGIPIETRTYHLKSLLKAHKVLYTQNNNIILPATDLVTDNDSLMTDSTVNHFYTKDLIYTKYSVKGNPQEIYSRKNGYTTIFWGYDGMYPIAKIQNCRFSQISETLGGEAYINKEELKDVPDNNFYINLNALRSKIPCTDVYTMQYDPLVGVTAITDSTGFTIYYEYDLSGRLISQYYMVNNIKHYLKKYSYNYANK